MPAFLRSYEALLATAEAFKGQDDIDGEALTAGLAVIRARAEAGFTAGTYLDLQGSRSGGLPAWEEVLLAALATHMGLADDVEPGDLETARRIALA